jgi:hypothetical protein
MVNVRGKGALWQAKDGQLQQAGQGSLRHRLRVVCVYVCMCVIVDVRAYGNLRVCTVCVCMCA